MEPLHTLAARHLSLRLRPLNRALRLAAALQHEAGATWRQPKDDGLSISDRQALALLDEIDALHIDAQPPLGFLEPGAAEARLQERMRAQARELGERLPLDALSADLRLSSAEVDTLLLCLAPELDRGYGRLYAYVCDDLHLDKASPELLSRLAPRKELRVVARAALLDAHGRLRRLGLIRPTGEADLERRTLFRVTPRVLPALLGERARSRRFLDPAEEREHETWPVALLPDADRLRRLATELRCGAIDSVGIWGPAGHARAEAIRALAAEAGLPLRRWPAADASVREALETAASLESLLEVELEAEGPAEDASKRTEILSALSTSPARVVLSAERPWILPESLPGRRYVELTLTAPDTAHRSTWWQHTGAGLNVDQCNDLASRFHFSPRQIRSATRLASHQARLDAGQTQADSPDRLEAACNRTALSRSSLFVTLVQPRRNERDLILPADLHRRVLEIPENCRSAARVDEAWGFGRLRTGGGSTRVLLTGDSGTGKSLTAEVITGLLGPGKMMMKANLAALVSKWVGETEKNLDEVFLAAESSHAVLFFDEADALFGKRGEVQRGSDRYANLEVGFLLQRLEEFGREGSQALVILASNHKDQIDPAFARRFQVVLHFPRPDTEQRLGLWRLAFPAAAPLSGEVDFEVLKRLDLTGAGIVSVARDAALLAHRDGRAEIGMAEIARAIARQFQQEARVLPISELGNHAHWAEESA